MKIEQADLLAAIQKLLQSAKTPVTPEVERLLADLQAHTGAGDEGRFLAALQSALPELQALRSQIPAALAEPIAATPPLDPARAQAALTAIATAWAAQDGAAVDQALATLPAPPDPTPARIEREVRDSISAHFAGFRLKPLSEG